MKILLITNLFPPDELAGAALYGDFAAWLRDGGHEVRILATFSYYPAWSLRPEDRGIGVRDESWNSVPVRRISMYVPAHPGGVARLLSDLSFFFSILARNFSDGWLPDVIVTASPMFSQCLAQRFLYIRKKIPRLIMVQDFVVDAALELGLLRAPLVGGLLRRLERWSLRSAATLTTISEPMLAKLRDIVGSDRRLRMIPNWVHDSLAQEICRARSAAGPRDPALLFYSGNLGVKQGLPAFLSSFAKVGGNWKLKIHGGGAELQKLRALAGAGNFALGPILDERGYVGALLSCTACLITQKSGVGANFLPSKLLPALATGTPVLAVCDADSPLAREVVRGDFGLVLPPGDSAALRLALENWQNHPAELARLGQNALICAENFRRDKILPLLEAELNDLVQ